MVEPDDVATIELHVRELTEHALVAARERAACEAALKNARETLAAAEKQLPEAEREAKERRQAQNDAIRGRAELEHRLTELIEAEDLTRARRQQAEQRAQGFRAAAAFAGAGRFEADAANDNERYERERLVEERATREAAAAEARASEELAEETKIGRHRAEIEAHVDAERALEAEIASDRTSAEALVVALREKIESATFAVHEAEVQLARLDADRDRLAQERAVATERLREVGMRACGEIEARIAALRSQELELVRRREEQERLLASLIASAAPPEPEPEPEHEIEPEPAVEPGTLAAHADEEDDIVPFDVTTAPSTNGSHDPHHAAQAGQATAAPAGDSVQETRAHEAPPPEPHFSTVTFKATPATREPAPQRTPEPPGGYGDDGPGFRSMIGNIFTRRKPVEEPILDEGPSIADRIARDFGLLGAADDDDAEGDDQPGHAQSPVRSDDPSHS
jgi:hypothetical protein